MTINKLMSGASIVAMLAADDGAGSADAVTQIKMLISSGDIDLADYRAMYMKYQGVEFPGTDDQIIAVIAASEDDQEEDAWAGLMHAAVTGNQPPITDDDDDTRPLDDDVTVQRQSVSVYTAADAFSKNATAVKDAEEYALAPEVLKFNPGHICKMGMSGKIEGFRLWPIVGSKRVEGTLQPYDLYSRPVPGSDTPLKGSWYDDWAHATVLGKAWYAERQRYYKSHENVEGADAELVTRPKAELKAKYQAYDKRLRKLADCARTAASLYRAMEAIKVNFPNITLDFQLDGSADDAWTDRDIVPGIQSIFWMMDNKDPRKNTGVAASEVLRMNIAKAKAAMEKDPKLSQYDAIRATIKKKKGRKGKGQGTEDKTGTGEDAKKMLSLVEFPTWVVRGANLMDWASEKGSENISMLSNSAAKWSDDDVQSFATVRAALDVIWERAELNDRLDKITKDKASAEKAARAAENAVKKAAAK